MEKHPKIAATKTNLPITFDLQLFQVDFMPPVTNLAQQKAIEAFKQPKENIMTKLIWINFIVPYLK